MENKKPLGAYLEIESPERLPSLLGASFKHLQTLAATNKKFKKYRFRNDEWTQLSMDTDTVYHQYLDTERAAFAAIVSHVVAERDILLTLYRAIAELDVSCGMAVAAAENHWTRPTLSTSDQSMGIVNGRHPVVENVLQTQSREFISNGVQLGSDKHTLAIITGANMGGKSTFLRQCALIQVMAQAGFYVPCADAYLPIVDCLFSRVGSTDNLAQNQSSFKVEMMELA